MRAHRLVRRLRRLAPGIAFVALAAGAAALVPAPGAPEPQEGQATGRAVVRPTEAGQGEPAAAEGKAMGPRWKEVDQLIADGRFQAALEKVEAILEEARAGGDDRQWTRALIRRVQLETGLHSYETAVRRLVETPWPDSPLYRSVLGLFYGESLRQYFYAYSWEIRQRERVETGGELALDRWSADQIAAEIHRAYATVWAQRQQWGERPIGLLAEYIEQNDYPPRIRGTLRDAVTYLWVDLLADTSLWRTEHSAEVYRLDLERLLGDAGRVGLTDPAELTGPELHPLVKVAFLLADLEDWHLAAERPEAAFEARRVRLERLWGSFTADEDRRALEADLSRASGELGESFEWWSMGMATLAEWRRQGEGEEPQSLVRALEAARAGAEAHPGSVGGKRCRAIAATIEAPGYDLTTMASDGAGRRSIAVNHKNLERLHFRAFRLDVAEVVTRARDYNLLPAYREIPEILRQRQPDAEWSADLPPTPDYRFHRTYVTPPMEQPGLWVVAASARRDLRTEGNHLAAVNLLLTDLVLVVRNLEDGQEVTVREGAGGEAAAGVEVELYRYDWRQGHRRVAARPSGDDGRVRFELDPGSREGYFLLARRGADAALDPSYFHAAERRRQEERTAALIYTDRSVYRPGQEVLWKVVAYRGRAEEGRFRTLAATSLTVELVDANGQVAASAEVESNDFGSASGSFVVPPGRLLGGWQLRTSLGGATAVQVEEYKRPTFEVTVTEPPEPLRLNRPATLAGEARYYFGLPVTEGEVRWQVTREPLFPRWWWWWGYPPEPPRVVAAGRTALDADGGFEVAFTPEADERQAAPGLSYHFRLSADVTDPGGETRSASRLFRLGFVAVEVAVETDLAFFLAGTSPELTLVRTDLDGVGRAGEGSWRLLALEQPAEALLPAEQPLPEPPPGTEAGYLTEGDRKRPRWEPGLPPEAVLALWPDGAEAAAGTVRHGEDGKARLELPPLPAGAYRLRYETTDPFGARYETRRELVVAADGADALALPAVLMVEKRSVPVGGAVRLLAHSGLEDQEMVLEIFHDGERRERRLLASGHGAYVLEIPVRPEDRGGFGVRLTALADYQLMSPEASVFVPWDDRRLTVELATFRDQLRPGEKETWRVTVRGDDEAAVGAGAAELLAYMYDRSLDLFAPHRPPDPLTLYPTFTGVPGVRASLGAAGAAWQAGRSFFRVPDYPQLRQDRLKFFDGYGIGGPGRRMPVVMRQRAVAEELVTVTSEAPPMPPPAAEGMVALDAEAKVATAAPMTPGQGGPPEIDAPPEEPVELREDFAETAFWEPHLLTGPDGSATLEFQVPESVTEWNAWFHAVTRDLRAGSAQEKVKTVKELLVRPYLPRFLREGDRAEVKVVVNNASEEPLSGRLEIRLFDPESGDSLLAAWGLPAAAAAKEFTVPPGGGADLTFPLATPPRVGAVAFEAVARAGAFSDGERRPLPVLPGRVHLAQSRFAALRDEARRTLAFPDLAAGDDPSLVHDQLVVTLDAQLFYSVLAALPYLVEYPYDCTEQVLNRYLSTGIVASLFDRYPAVARMAKELSARETRFEAWAEPDPNRKMALEETPWLVAARGGEVGEDETLIKVLDPEVAAAQQRASLAQLQEAQTAVGGFPWWPGGPPSPYMTAYLLHGFAKGMELGVEAPKDVVVRAFGYLHRHFLDEMVREMVKDDCCWQLVTFLNYVLSSYPDSSWTGDPKNGTGFTDDDRRRMLDFSWRHWREHSPLLKSYLALTLERAGRNADARRVWESVMDSARTSEDLGTYWAPEDRAWLWYNDTTETHAFALRTLLEIEPDDPRRHGLVRWLFLDKKLNHWKSTRATAEVIYSLVHYLEEEGTLGAAEAATVTAGPRRETFRFEPDRYTGKKNQVVIPGAEVEPAMAEVVVEKQTPGLLFASATWHFSTEKMPEEERGDFFSVSRRFFKRVQEGREWVLRPLEEGALLAPGDQVEVQLTVRTKHAAEYVHLRDPRPAGFEPESLTSGYRRDLRLGYYEEVRDSGADFFIEWLPVGEYTLKHRLRANLAGTFKAGPATLQSMYAPEFTAYSAGATLAIGGGE